MADWRGLDEVWDLRLCCVGTGDVGLGCTLMLGGLRARVSLSGSMLEIPRGCSIRSACLNLGYELKALLSRSLHYGFTNHGIV